jgi:hypothetical protein
MLILYTSTADTVIQFQDEPFSLARRLPRYLNLGRLRVCRLMRARSERFATAHRHRLPLLPISTALAKAAPLSASLLVLANKNLRSFEVPAKSQVDIFI